MEMIATTIAQRFNNDGHAFQTVQGESLDGLCGSQAVRVDEAFGKKRFIFNDGSAITVGHGHWYLGFAHCFCVRAEGHFQGCDNQEPVQISLSDAAAPQQERGLPEASLEVPSLTIPDVPPAATAGVSPRMTPEVPSVALPEVLPSPPSFTIRTYGKINSTIAIDGSHSKARREARALLSSDSGISHVWLTDADGKIVDAYELAALSGGGFKIKKIRPGELDKLRQFELPL
ncbi:MAG: hypothetical protein HW380_3581 [Magnetococcales bacterium]|nr:hypothetical protein [Magnetococcales bacterium]HIJ82972.1 hypothetical protein [Magnetococcales bacterium]